MHNATNYPYTPVSHPPVDTLLERLRRRHCDYDGPLGRAWWKLCRDAASGEGGFRYAAEHASADTYGAGDYTDAASSARIPPGMYLARFDRETPLQFVSRLKSTHYRNHISRVLTTYNGDLWRRPPQRAAVSDAVTAWWANVDGQGLAVGAWLQKGAREAHLHGWCAAYFDREVTDAPGLGPLTARWLRPEEIVDWSLGSDGALEWVRLCTEIETRDPVTGATTEREEYTTWTRQWWWRVVIEEREGNASALADRHAILKDTGQVPHDLGAVPVSILRWEPLESTCRLYSTSHMASAIGAALELFNVASEGRHVERGTAFPILCVQDPNEKVLQNLKLGVHNGLRVAPDMSMPAMLTQDASLSEHFEKRRAELRAEIYHAVSLDPPAEATQVVPESGVARAYRFEMRRAALVSATQQLQAFERQCVELVARWSGVTEPAALAAVQQGVTVVYPTDFDVETVGDVVDEHGAVLDQRDQLAPVTVRASRLAIGRAVNPHATGAETATLREEVEKLYQRERDALMNASTPPKEIFGYDLTLGLVPVNRYLASKGMDPIEGGDVPIAIYLARHGLLPGLVPVDAPAQSLPATASRAAPTGAPDSAATEATRPGGTGAQSGASMRTAEG